jgi:hypothetical protein
MAISVAIKFPSEYPVGVVFCARAKDEEQKRAALRKRTYLALGDRTVWGRKFPPHLGSS